MLKEIIKSAHYLTAAKYRVYLLAILLLPKLAGAQDGDQIFNAEILHEIRISFAQQNYWEELTENYQEFSTFSGSDIPYSKCTITIDGETLQDVGIRLKGKSSYYYANDLKKPFKIDFNEFIDDQSYDGIKKINLQNGIGDPGMLRDYLSFDLMRNLGVAAPRVSYAKVFINNEFWGLYEIIEQIDRTFLDENFSKDGGNLYKNQRWSSLQWWGEDVNTYRDTFELKTNVEENDWSRFIDLLDLLNNSSDEEFAQEFPKMFNVDYFLNVLAVDIFINNWDSYISNSRNFYLYDEPGTGQFHWIPWDYNLSHGGDLDTYGNPFPPYDPDCVVKADFVSTHMNKEVTFLSHSEPVAQNYFWDFGDGNQSTLANPIHTYEEIGTYNVCLTLQRSQGSQTCEQKRCRKVDLTFNPGACNSIMNGTANFDPSDPIFQQVIAQDDFCCNDEWDVFCQIAYNELQNEPAFDIQEGTNYQLDFPLIHTSNPKKVLINRILNIDSFKEKYLEIACILREQYFNESYLFPKIDAQSNLLRETVYSDANFLYSTDYFEYDIGNGTGGGSDAYIPSLKHFYKNRFEEIDEYIAEESTNCGSAMNSLAFQDVVINEFMASNNGDSDIADPNGDTEDWIEIFNNTSLPIDLSDYYLSDDLSMPFKWKFPNETVIAANGYLIVWADNDLQEEGLHASFKLSSSGEEIVLSHKDGSVIDVVTFGAQEENQSSARFPNGTGNFEQGAITFNQFNGTTDVRDLVTTQSLNIFPNPSSGTFTVDVPKEIAIGDYSINLYNSIGQKIIPRSISYGSRQIKISLEGSGIAKGMYRVELICGNKIFIDNLITN